MKRIIILLVSILIFSCSEEKKNRDTFIQTYKEVLIIREAESDTSKANKMVRDAIQEKGYTLERFQQEFFELANKDKEFVKVIDSLRNSLNSDIKKLRDSIRNSKLELESDSGTQTKE